MNYCRPRALAVSNMIGINHGHVSTHIAALRKVAPGSLHVLQFSISSRHLQCKQRKQLGVLSGRI